MAAVAGSEGSGLMEVHQGLVEDSLVVEAVRQRTGLERKKAC
jgi:hypothetical protein